mmetsp:Transcript_116860/g.184836  ORF Transcript_116860/g.184836 Transcript_116860/m.184836 type:complete len:161 (+) Transcript_116860:34-516(+)
MPRSSSRPRSRSRSPRTRKPSRSDSRKPERGRKDSRRRSPSRRRRSPSRRRSRSRRRSPRKVKYDLNQWGIEGSVVDLRNGFGFIRPTDGTGDGRDLYFHAKTCSCNYNDLKVGDKVVYEIEQDQKRDRPNAKNVRLNGKSDKRSRSKSRSRSRNRSRSR